MVKNSETKTAVFGPFVYVVICNKLDFYRKHVAKDAIPSWVSCNERGFWPLNGTKMRKIIYFLRRLFMKGNWVTWDAPLDQGDSFLLLFLISRWTWFLFYLLPFTGKKSYAKKQLFSTLLYLTQVWICAYFLGVLQLCFDFEARVWLVIG